MNPILLQKQLRENASDLQDFCKDLKEWGESMKRKEDSTKKPDSEKKSSDIKVRKIHTTEKKIHKKEGTTKKPAAKIGTTDYAAWEKFDADAECERLEDDANDDSELTDECNEKQDEALIEKEKGNKFVHQQKWDEAITCYTKAIECYSFDPIFFANRALCYLKKGKFQEAERDCTLSIKLDNTYVKAYQRRAAAKEALGRLEEAEYDTLRVLELEPKNKECRVSLERLRKELGKFEKPLDQRPVSKFTASRNKTTPPDKTFSPMFYSKPDTKIPDVKPVVDTSKPVSIWPEQNNIILVKPINKPPHLRSKKPLKRIEIKEINTDKIESKIVEIDLPKEPEAVNKHVFEKKIVEEKIQEVSREISEFKKKQVEKSLEKLDNLTALPMPGLQTACLKSDDLKVVEKKPKVSDNLPNIKDAKNTSNINISNGDNKASVGQDKSTEFLLPKTSVQFYLTWKNLKNTEDKYKYLKMIRPEELPKIFLDSLESNIFSNILEILVKHFVDNNDGVFEILENLTEVKRFGMLVMFKTSSDISNLWKLFDYIKETEQKNKQDVDILIQKYEL